MSGINRRQFVGGVAGAVAGGVAGAGPAQAAAKQNGTDIGPVDRRTLGKTGWEIGLLGLGLGSRYTIPFKDDPEAGHEILEQAIAMGINWFDTARAYGPSEELIGPVVAKHRKQVLVSTKSQDRSYDGFKRDVETSLKKLQTDYVDNMHIHSMKPEDEPNLKDIDKGAARAARELKEEGVVRAFGISGHSGPDILMKGIKTFEPDTMLTTLPASQPANGGYEGELLTLAREHNVGVMAMKSFRRSRDANLDGVDLIRYPLSLKGVSCAVVGLDSLQHLKVNARAVTNFDAMSDQRMRTVSAQVQHDLAGQPNPWEMPGYEDVCRV